MKVIRGGKLDPADIRIEDGPEVMRGGIEDLERFIGFIRAAPEQLAEDTTNEALADDAQAALDANRAEWIAASHTGLSLRAEIAAVAMLELLDYLVEFLGDPDGDGEEGAPALLRLAS